MVEAARCDPAAVSLGGSSDRLSAGAPVRRGPELARLVGGVRVALPETWFCLSLVSSLLEVYSRFGNRGYDMRDLSVLTEAWPDRACAGLSAVGGVALGGGGRRAVRA